MLQELIEKIKKYNPTGDFEIIYKAYEFALNAHQGQKRVSGEDYIIHPTAVAEILADLNMDNLTIAAGMLHDVVEDTKYDYNDIKLLFGDEVAMLVDGVTKLGKLEYRTKEEQQAENLRKMFIAMARDIRVILIKLADRLHNLRTLKYMSKEKQYEKAKETLEIYAPIAHRLGIYKIKWEMEDLALRYIDPEGYYDLVEKVAKKRKEREEYINYVIETLKNKNKEMGIDVQIEGRPKNFYSIYKKMFQQNKTFEQIFDLTAIRVIVDTVKDCYGVLGIVHTLWKPIPGRFKDYIAMPKPNMYQSLHTTVIGPAGEPIEVQIRTWEMHRTSEYGIAAHWKYKEGRTSQNDFDEKLKWLRQMLEWQNEVKDTKEFMETLKIDLVIDEVYVFTPKGDVIDLPVDSSPIDFAYKIHSAIGNKCVGAKINGKIVPLDYKLQNGDIVEIITSANSNGPSRDWLKIVKSSQAKNKIRQWFKKEKREENIQKGKDILDKEIKRLGSSLSIAIKSEWLETVYKKIGLNSLDDLYASLGYGGLTLNQVMMRLKEEIRKNQKIDIKDEELLDKQLEKPIRKKKRLNTGVKVKGVDNILVRFSKCCNPVPGDEILGYITKGRGVSIHRRDCPNAADLLKDTDRLIEVEWNTQSTVSYNADVQVRANDRQGLLAEITSIINESKINIVSFYSRTSKDKAANINFVLEINDIDQLNRLIRKLRRIEGVIDVFRAKQ
ncbi:RelA/SpoT family protein [Lutispora thermophila]|uniref:GTP diphosphokinase n=1 Tax=Lutispora thermophila DSM 19022 TaxID=1122184 RepID=A0A1M6HNV9_9FIRM|nr:bifunctional (p)ppGpp synthetase/guanosine-3',5'-bis(diphosphate) 3'-pyrophosphohydrolase [Lutispora thermophila]SHJ23895.1 GTP pyrophosphokinase [Lutispora thermophila DSM 19022]